jgi:hypothetical protein
VRDCFPPEDSIMFCLFIPFGLHRLRKLRVLPPWSACNAGVEGASRLSTEKSEVCGFRGGLRRPGVLSLCHRRVAPWQGGTVALPFSQERPS